MRYGNGTVVSFRGHIFIWIPESAAILSNIFLDCNFWLAEPGMIAAMIIGQVLLASVRFHGTVLLCCSESLSKSLYERLLTPVLANSLVSKTNSGTVGGDAVV